VKDVATHMPGVNQLVGPADHTLAEDIDPRRGGRAIMRYPSKAFNELEHFGRMGIGRHVETSPEGVLRGDHTAWEGFLSLLGVSTKREEAERSALNDAYEWITENNRVRTIERRHARQELERAIESGDREAVGKATKGMNRDQLRAFYKQRQQARYNQLLERVPREQRAEFARRFKDRLTGDAR
jgi:hypothetical protein